MAKYNFDDFKKDALTRPKDLAWQSWAKFEKVGDKVQGYIRDAFFRPAEGMFKDQRGITIEQTDGVLVNVGLKRNFTMDKTNTLRIGDPITIVFEEEKASSTKGYKPTKIFSFYGTNLPENATNPTVAELEAEDIKAGGSVEPTVETEEEEQAPF